MFPDHNICYSAEMTKESSQVMRREQFWARMVEELGQSSADQLKEALDSGVGDGRSLRLNSLRGVEETKKLFESAGFDFIRPMPWEPNGYWVEVDSKLLMDRSPLLGAGLGYLHEAGAMEVVSKLDPQPGDFVLDMCAAPGGKATQILERLGTSGWLVANDPVKNRADRMNALCARHGSTRVTVLSQDPDSISKIYESRFDRILVDAPCSSESFFAKPNDKRVDVPDAEVAGCARRQFLILDRASKALAPGGTIAYSTCTYSRAENSDLVRAFLEAHEDFELVEEKYRFPHVDKVPGGYWAIIAHKGEKLERRHLNVDSVRGLLRHGVCNWNGEVDVYAKVMRIKGMPDAFDGSILSFKLNTKEQKYKFTQELEFNDEEAQRYLAGEAIVKVAPKGHSIIKWKGFVLGAGKSTGDRINNALPKLLRALR